MSAISSVIDEDTYNTLHELMGGEEFIEIINFFRSDTQQALQNIHEAIQSQNADMIGIICHKLKSSSRLIGANQLADLANELEHLKSDFDREKASALVGKMDINYQTIITWMDQQTVSA